MQPLRDNARILAAATVGTAVEYYDFFIYATAAALVFGPLFFPSASETAQTLAAFASFGVAFVARPIGAIAFGHFGDRIGRKSTLVVSLLMMGASTLAIGLLPTYAQAGWIAPALLCLMRFGQGFGLGGEWGGAALLATENAPPGWQARFGAAPQLGIPIGLVTANGMFMLLGAWLSDAEFMAWGWRIPFIASAVLVLIGFWVRNRVGETPAFRAALEREAPVPVPLAQVLSRHLGAALAGSAGVIVVFVTFYLATAWALAEGTGRLGYPREGFLAWQLLADAVMTGGIFTAAWIADKTRPATALMIASATIVVMGALFGHGLASGSLTVAGLTLVVMMFFMGMTNGPMAGWLTSLFPVRVRYSGVSFAFNTGGILGGAVTPGIALMISSQWGVAYAGLLASGAALLSLIGFVLARPAAE